LSLLDRGTDAKVDRARTRASSGPARAVQIRRLLAGTSRRKIAVLSLLMLLVGVGVAGAGPAGSILDNDPKLGQGLAKAGPVNPSTQFPDWYRDKSGVTLEPCLEPKNPMCIIGDERR